MMVGAGSLLKLILEYVDGLIADKLQTRPHQLTKNMIVKP